MYLVVGAAGPVGLGGTICRLLRDRGEPVGALVRPTASRSRVAELQRMGVELVEGDLKNRASLDGACHDASAVVSTASVMVSPVQGFRRDCRRKRAEQPRRRGAYGGRRIVRLRILLARPPGTRSSGRTPGCAAVTLRAT